MITIYDIDNNPIKCKILFNFQKGNKRYIVFRDNENNILASLYGVQDHQLLLWPIKDDTDFDVVDKELEERKVL